MSTQKEGIQYLHILEPTESPLFIHNVDHTLVSARYIDSGKKIRFRQIKEGLFLYMDKCDFHPIDTVPEPVFELKKGCPGQADTQMRQVNEG